jgi:kynurenine formamidase
MVGRGVLLDVARYKGQDPLPSDYWITLEDLQNTAKAQKTEIQKGDILLVRTGWRKVWDEPGDDGRVDLLHRKWHRPQPGVGPDSLAFFNEMEIVAIGSDNAAVEWGFPVNPNYARKAFGFPILPMHPEFLWSCLPLLFRNVTSVNGPGSYCPSLVLVLASPISHTNCRAVSNNG